MKKILYIAVSSQTGGAPKHIQNILKFRGMREKEEYEIIVTVPSDGEYYQLFQKENIRMLDMPFKPYSFRSLWKLARFVRKERIALVHSHGKGAGMYARPLKWFCPWLRVVHTFHGIHLEQYGTVLRNVYCLIERVLRRNTDAFICVSDSEREEALRLRFADPGKTAVIYNGIEIGVFQNAEDSRNKYLKEFGFAEDSWVIGCVARLEKVKGHMDLLRGFQLLLNKIPQCRLILAGDGPDRNMIEREIQTLGLEQKVRILGFRRDVPELMKFFDVFVLASLKEGMPYTLIEALAAEVPVVATDVMGNRDVIVNEQCGFLVPPEDPQKLAEKLEMLHDNPEWAERFKKQGKCRAESLFAAEDSVKKLFDVYGELI